MRALVLPLAVLFVAGCGASRVPPPPNPPELGRPGPPPAWVEAKGRAQWLGYSTYCWPAFGCADYGHSCSVKSNRPPIIRVDKGESLRFHVGFEPKAVSVSTSTGARTQKLETRRDPTWRVSGHGLMALLTVRKAGGDAVYVACLRITPAP